MATATVVYLLQLGGDLPGKLPGVAAGLDRLKASAASASEAIKAGRGSLNEWGEESKRFLEGAAKSAAAIALIGYGVNRLLEKNEAWRESTARLTNELGKMRDRVANAIGPTVSGWVDNFTIGLVYLTRLIGGSLVPVIQAATTAFQEYFRIGTSGLATFLDALARGDLRGAVASLVDTAGQQMTNLSDQLEVALAGIDTARSKALADARAAWQRQVDGKRDGKRDSALTQEEKSAAKDAAAAAKERAAAERTRAAEAQAVLRLAKTLTEAADSAAQLSTTATALQGQFAQIMVNIAAGALSSASSGGVAGLLASVGGPIGGTIASIYSVVKDLPDVVWGILDEIAGVVSGADEWLAHLVNAIPYALQRIIPDMAAGLVVLLPKVLLIGIQLLARLPAAMLRMIPQFLVSLMAELRGLGDYIVGSFVDSIRDAFRNVTDVGRQAGDALGIHLGKEAAVKTLFGVKLPFLADGGEVARSGLVYAHAGERYLGAPGRSSSVTSSQSIVIGQVVAPDVRRLVDELKRAQGSYGLGLSLTPYAGR